MFYFIPIIILLFGVITIIGQRHYQYNQKHLCIKSSKKFLSGQELSILCGSLCCIAIPILFILNASSNIRNSFLNDLLSNPIAMLVASAMLLCPLAISLISIYIVISNYIKSHKPDFVRKIILNSNLNYIRVYYNNSTIIIPFDEVEDFRVKTTRTQVSNVRPNTIRAGLKLGGAMGGAGVFGTQSGNEVVMATDIEIIISTIHNKMIKINTLGNVLFDGDSAKLLASLNQYKTKFKNFSMN